MNRDYFKFAIDNLRHRKLRSWLTMLGIFIGIAAVVALIGLGEGLRTAITSQFGFLSTDILTISASGGFGPPGTGVVNPLTDKELDAIKKIPGIEGAAGRIIESGTLEFNKKVGFGYAASMPDGEDRSIIEKSLNMEAQKGRLLEDGDSGVVLLGANFYENDELFGKPITPGSKIKLLGVEFEVIGIMEKKGNFQMDGTVFMNEDDLRELTNRLGDDYDVMVAKFNQNADVEKIKANIEKELRKIRDVKEGEEDFSVQTPASILESVNSVLLGIQIFVYIIAGISILVGGIGIMNTMYTAVVERTKEVGIMKSIGAKNSTIFSLFFIESGLLGSIGGIVGAIIGYLLANGFAFVGRLVLGSRLIAANISPQLIIGAILFSFVLGSFFGTLPAVQASKLNPVDALRSTK
jgi:putative ABC transport system permease protein